MSRLRIGPYTIYRMVNGKFWIQHADGEGMEISETNLAEWLTKLWAAEF